MKTKIAWMISLILLLVGTFTPAMAIGPQGMSVDRLLRQSDRLNLTAEQQSQLEALALNQRKQRVESKAEMDLAQIEKRELMTANQLDAEAIKEKIRTIHNLHTTEAMALVDTLVEVRKILNDDQWNQVKYQLSRPIERNKRGNDKFDRARGFRDDDQRRGYRDDDRRRGYDDDDDDYRRGYRDEDDDYRGRNGGNRY